MTRITVTCNKCEASATVDSIEAMNIWWDKHTCGETGGFLGQDMNNVKPVHHCTRPSTQYPLGLIWQCGDCNKTYRLETVRDRGISANEWAPYTDPALQP